MLVLCFLLPLATKGVQHEDDHKCGTENVIRCCDDYFQQEGQCLACPKGTTSSSGGPCNPCTDGFFGLFCSEECKCNSNERCNKIDGGCKPYNSDEKQQPLSSSLPYGTTSRPPSSSAADSTKDYIYLTAAVCILTFVVLICVIINCLRSRCRNNALARKSNVEMAAYVDSVHVYGYHEINEDNFRENIIMCPPQVPDTVGTDNHITEKISDSSNNGDLSKHTEISAYLNPYQPILKESTDAHEYKTTTDTKKDEYLHPYQPLMKEKIVHVYNGSSKVNNDDEFLNPDQPVGVTEKIDVQDCNFTSEEKKDDYLNPYQPVITDTSDIHEYKSTREGIEYPNLKSFHQGFKHKTAGHNKNFTESNTRGDKSSSSSFQE